MKKSIAVLVLSSNIIFAQTVSQKLETATKNLLSTDLGRVANLSIFVTDDTGKAVFDYQGDKGLSTASTQKIFTAAAALETLGSNYTYTTKVSYTGELHSGNLHGNLIISSNGDPTLGSWRYDNYKPENFQKQLIDALKKQNITKISGDLVLDDMYFDFQKTPGGWPWDDMGNYYGAGVWGLNWRENQFDINIKGTEFQSFSYHLENITWANELKAGGNSDQSLIFTAPYSNVAVINGTLPAGKVTTVSGATPNPPLQLGAEVKNWLKNAGIDFAGNVEVLSLVELQGKRVIERNNEKNLLTYQSPTLDKIVYWFLRKSVNFYGETLIKTMGKEKKNNPSFKSGVAYLKEFWKSKGINSAAINFADGSGLSPQNYVSARAEVQALLYAQKQAWFSQYYDGFPTQDNGMKMKSGTMRDVKSFAGYHTAKDGKRYVYAAIINNYQGSGGAELQKILNVLK